VDKVVLAASATHPAKIKTAIVCQPTIYGAGRGPGNRRSVQVNLATKTFLEQREAFSVGKGQNVWHGVYVQDLSSLFLLLGETATNGGSPATWNDQGYYLAKKGHFVWRDVFQVEEAETV
jgi:THO complex subunit 2